MNPGEYTQWINKLTAVTRERDELRDKLEHSAAAFMAMKETAEHSDANYLGAQARLNDVRNELVETERTLERETQLLDAAVSQRDAMREFLAMLDGTIKGGGNIVTFSESDQEWLANLLGGGGAEPQWDSASTRNAAATATGEDQSSGLLAPGAVPPIDQSSATREEKR